MDIDLELVRPCDSHARIVMDWRNDPQTLAASFDQAPKEWDSFRQEFRDSYFSTAHLPPLFAVENGERIGFVRLRPFDRGFRRACELSINLAPLKRGAGRGTKILEAVSPIVASHGYDDIIAEIKEGNTGSIRAFEAAGYTLLERCKKRGEQILRYRLALTPDPLGQHSVFVIAEAGSNWRAGTPEKDWARAKDLIDVAVDAGADAVKFQVYRASTIYVENAGFAGYLSDRGMEQSISSIFEELSMPYEMIARLADYSKQQGIQFMSSAFSLEDFAEVDPYVEVHKIASYELGHLRLLEQTARSGKPLVLSTGAAVEKEIAWAVDTFRANGGGQLTLLQCTAKYPADPASMNLRVIPWLKQRFGVAAGLSDHSRDPLTAPTAAVALGATVIEKHYTMDNSLKGPDHYFSVVPPELKAMVEAIRNTELIVGSGHKEVLEAEEELRSYARRGVQAIQDIKVGDSFAEGKNIEILRPGQQELGVHPKHIPDINGKTAKRDIPLGTGIRHGDW